MAADTHQAYSYRHTAIQQNALKNRHKQQGNLPCACFLFSDWRSNGMQTCYIFA